MSCAGGCEFVLVGEIMAGAERRAEEKGEMRTLQSRTPVDESWPTTPPYNNAHIKKQ
jgi:hypothetical protein